MDDKFILSIKQEFLKMVAGLFETGALDLNSVKEPAKIFRMAVDTKSIDNLKINIKDFVDKYPLFGNLYTFMLKKIDELNTQSLMQTMENHFSKQGGIL